MSYNPKGGDALKLLTVFRVEAYHELLIRLKQGTIFSTAEVISTNEVFKYPLAELPRFCRYF